MAGRFICRLIKLGYMMELLILAYIYTYIYIYRERERESTDGVALQGNGWYCDSVIDKALNYKLITS